MSEDTEPAPSVVSFDERDGSLAIDEALARQRVEQLLSAWDRSGHLRRVRRRTRTLAGAALLVAVGAHLLLDAATGLTSQLLWLWRTVGLVALALTGPVYWLLRGVERPGDVPESGAIERLAIVLLAVGAAHHAKSPVTRGAWRFLLSDVPGTVTGAGDRSDADPHRATGEDDRVPLARYVRLAAALSAGVVVVHQGWLAATGGVTIVGPVDAPGVPSGGSLAGGWLGSLGPVETAGLFVAAIVVGAVSGLWLAVVDL